MNENTQDQLKTVMGLVADIRPRNLLIISEKLYPLLEASNPECSLTRLDLRATPLETLAEKLNPLVNKVDMVLIAEDIEALDNARATQVIGQLRNLLNAQIIVLLSSNAPLGFNGMIGLGFKQESVEQGLATYTYDIANYNKKREWNNSRFWANPQNFNKFRW